MKLLPKYQINFLRDLRKLSNGWLLNNEYLDFLETYPIFEKTIRNNEVIIKEATGLTAEEFLNSIVTDRPSKNFNEGNRLKKSRYKWTKPQIQRLRRIRGL